MFPTPSEPTRGIFKYQLAKALQADFDVTVVCPLPWCPRLSPLKSIHKWYRYAEVPLRYNWYGLDVHAPRYPMLPGYSQTRHSQLMAWGVSKTVERLHRQRPFDLANSHWLYPDSVVAQELSEGFGIPHIPTGSGCDVNEFLEHPRKRAFILTMLRRAAHSAVVSESLRDRMIESGVASDQITTIANGVDNRIFRPLDRKQARVDLGLSPKRRYILFVGRLSEEKGLQYLVEAFTRSTSGSTDCHLLVVGEGPLKRELSALAAVPGVRERVTFVGSVAHSEIATWINAAEVLCLPSLREGCPNVVLESLACGIPVVASDVGGVSQFVNPNNGVLTRPKDVSSLAEAVSDALSRDWGQISISNAMASWSWSRQARRYCDVFLKVLASHEWLRPLGKAS